MIEENVLMAANNYEQKYYFNNRFDKLPEDIKKELNIIAVMFTTRIGGIITFYFDEETGEIMIETDHNEEDILYDEIGSGLEVRKLQLENKELFEQLQLYYNSMELINKQK